MSDPEGVRVARERRRLRAAFGAALLAATAPAAIDACAEVIPPAMPDGGADSSIPPQDAQQDVSPSQDTGTLSSGDGGGEGDADAGIDGPDCTATYQLDGAFTDAPPDAQMCNLLLPCSLPTTLAAWGCAVVVAGPDGAPLPNDLIGCSVVEDAGCFADVFQPGDHGIELSCYCDIFVGGGRRPQGARPGRVRASNALGAYFARMSYEEAASVEAFMRLRKELKAHGAPQELQLSTALSERDEVRHARIMGRLARRCGAKPSPCGRSGSQHRVRDLERIALENAAEGCVRETYGALLLRWQGARANDRRLRRVFTRVAADETRHAALAWAIARWADSRLDGLARARVAQARRDAVSALARELAAIPDRAVVREAGLPTPPDAHRLLSALTLQLG